MTQRVPSLLRPFLAVVASLAMVFSLSAPADAATRGIAAVCEDPPPADYDDRDRIAEPHVVAVDCLTERGLVQGYGYDEGQRYLPAADVRRGQMATFVARLLTEAGVELPAPTDQGYEDVDDDHAHADAIRQLTSIGVVQGVTADRYEPGRSVTRAQMASYLIRAAAHQAGVEAGDLQGGENPFTDVASDSTHGPSIEGLSELGISDGVAEDRYEPHTTVRRDGMASFVARTFDAMATRTTVADRDGGALPHTVFTFAGEHGQCFEVTAGDAWVGECEPATTDTLQLRTIFVDEAFTVVAGLVAPEATDVVVEFEGTERLGVELVPTRETDLRAWASPILRSDIDAVVAYDGEREISRTSFGHGSGDTVSVTDVRIEHRTTPEGDFDRVVFDLTGDGLPGWRAEYVDTAREQGSGHTVQVEGDATLRILLDHVQYPPTDERVENGTRFAGTDLVREVYASNVYEGRSLFFVGTTSEAPFELFTLEDPPRLVLDVHHTSGG